ncbi:MAG TPA: hypothetical protein VGW12_18440 [Pyrinomonadaceae bacterium]|nr:hypothetical protein [Pyrinomonadaceae bacterium]
MPMLTPHVRSLVASSLLLTILILAPIDVLGIGKAHGFRVLKATRASIYSKYKPRYQTIAHRILELESEATVVDDSMYQLLDTFIDEAKAEIRITPLSEDRSESSKQVESILLTIDDILIRHNVIYPRNRKEDWTLLLRDGLTPTTLKGPELERILGQEHNRRRVNRLDLNKPFFLLDCDTASFVYLAIGEVLGLPLSMVDLPEHNFIRWSFDPQSYLNWETMYGRFRSNAEYRSFIGGADLAEDLYKRRVYLVAMSPQDVLGYCYGARALKWEKPELKDYRRAIEDYETSIKLYPRTPFAFNNLAWLLATNPDKKIRDGRKAIILAKQAVSINPTDASFLDTLGAAYAEDRQFEKAAEVEQRACDLSSKQLYCTLVAVYRGGSTYAQFMATKPLDNSDSKTATRH